jgi:hypothetical protein
MLWRWVGKTAVVGIVRVVVGRVEELGFLEMAW